MSNGTAPHASPTPLALYRVMRRDDAGRPRCGVGPCMLGARPRDLKLDDAGCVEPGSGGMSVGLDPTRLHLHFRPKRFGGLSPLPLFTIGEAQLGERLHYGPDGGDRGSSHGVIEAAARMPVSEYQAALGGTAAEWRVVE